MGKATPPLPPARCHDCDGVPHWRYRDRVRWHCVACCPCPDPDDATFTWDPMPDAPGSPQARFGTEAGTNRHEGGYVAPARPGGPS